jgi:hypothetical protein
MSPARTCATRLATLEQLVRSDESGTPCPECTAPRWSAAALPPGLLRVEEIETRVLAIVGGELFAAWPRCRRCGRLDARFVKAIPPNVALDADDIRQLVQDFRVTHEVAA